MLKRIGLLAAALLIWGCDDGVEPAEPSKTAELAAIKGRIQGLPDGQRNGVFLRAIRDAGQPCQEVIGSAYNGEYFGRPSWAARCREGQDWLVMIDAGGRALVARREAAPS
jgi:hypothetical protein